MRTLICGATVSLGILANAASAEQTLTIDGNTYPLSALMATCQGITDDAAKQIACFNNVSQLLSQQAVELQADALTVPDALEALRAAAEYEDAETGLSISGTDCSIRVVYFGNYFHLSRRNISALDVFSVSFDASKVQQDRTSGAAGGQAPLSRGGMESGAAASVSGGMALESSHLHFAPKSPRVTIREYAHTVAGQLPVSQVQDFEFVLVHPARSHAAGDIWSAFEDFVGVCKQQTAQNALTGNSMHNG